MSHHFSGRVTLIAIVLAVFLYAIFPIGTHSHLPNLKPGIDMSGGYDLVYEIKVPEGSQVPADLAVQVMESLKKRVDPNGVRNLIWRPQPPRRIEIQMPASGDEAVSDALKKTYVNAQDKLKQTNVRATEVVHAIEELKGAERDKKLAELANGSATRTKLFAELVSDFDARQKARAAKNVQLDVEMDQKYEQLKSQIEETNLSFADLQAVLDLKPQHRDERLAEIKSRFADFPARLAAIDEFARSYNEYQAVKDTIGSTADLKRLLKGSGVLEFHILADDLAPDEYAKLVERL